METFSCVTFSPHNLCQTILLEGKKVLERVKQILLSTLAISSAKVNIGSLGTPRARLNDPIHTLGQIVQYRIFVHTETFVTSVDQTIPTEPRQALDLGYLTLCILRFFLKKNGLLFNQNQQCKKRQSLISNRRRRINVDDTVYWLRKISCFDRFTIVFIPMLVFSLSSSCI